MTNDIMGSSTTRRQLLKTAAVGGAGVVTAAQAAPAHAAGLPGAAADRTIRLTVIGTTDLHGNVYNWDYFKNAEYDDRAHNDIGIAKAATLIRAVRDERGPHGCLTLDAGDTIQGTPLAYYFAKIEPITQGSIHPMAAAMNLVGYDAAALGNHEYNYGLDTLRAFEGQLNFPLLSANSVDWNTNAPVFKPFLIKDMKIRGERVRVGVLGLVTPGVAIWDKANVEDKVRFPGIVEQAKVFVPQLKQAGCDVVIVSSHSGTSGFSSYGDALSFNENASVMLAEQVPDIDAILVGHAHKEIPQLHVTNKATGRQVLLSEPYYWGMRVSVMDLDLRRQGGRWTVVSSAATLLNANVAPEDDRIAKAVRAAHQKVLTYVNSVIGTCTEPMSAATSRFEDTAAMDFINKVQGDAVKGALARTTVAGLPVLSIAAPFNKNAAIPSGDVTVRDVAGLYIYDNTLLGITLTGAQIRDYLEKSASYFQPYSGTGPVAADAITNAKGTPDYNYDILGGLDARLTYHIDLAEPVGSRITELSYDGQAWDDAKQFVVAINNYRQSGGGGFPHVATAPVVYNRQVEIRQLLIDWVSANKVVDPQTFSTIDWKLVSHGADITVTP